MSILIVLYGSLVREEEIRGKICMEVVRILKDERTRQGISMNQLAKMTGLTQPAISLLESEKGQKRNPKFDSLLRIARALDLELGTVVLAASKAVNSGTSKPKAELRSHASR